MTDLRNGAVVSLASHDGHAHGHDQDHEHGHDHAHDHGHVHEHVPNDADRTVVLEQAVLAKNNLLAERNRGWFEGRQILAVNIMSSPGSGKTTLLERTIRELRPELDISVIEGDQDTLLDAERIRATDCRVVQINTGSGCHLDAFMVAGAVKSLDAAIGSIVMIENVGNLVCPALFDLGERTRVAIMSVTEGADKPLKYPQMFRSAQVMVLNKVDLVPYVDFDVDHCIDAARRVNPGLTVFALSATRGDGLGAWYSWLREEQRRLR